MPHEVRELHGRNEPVPDGSGAGAPAARPADGPLSPVQGPRDRLTCGSCGGGVRGYRGVLHGRPIADWKHTDAPPGVAPHRPILGTPVDQDTLDRIHRPEVTEAPKKAPKPQATVVKTSPATADMLMESQSITAVLKLADLEGWAVVEKLYRELDDGTEYFVLKFRRRDLAAVALWRRTEKGWGFDDGFALSKRGYRQVQSTSLKDFMKTRDEACPDCGLSSIVHTAEGACP